MTEALYGRPALTPWEMEHGEMQRADVDFTNPFTEQPEYEAMIEVLRQEGPITYYPYTADPGYEGFWLITDNELARKALRESSVYSSYGIDNTGGGLMIHDLPPDLVMAKQLMIMQDDPAHHDQRRLVSKDFQSRSLEKAELAGFLATQAETLVRSALQQGEVDFVEAVAAPLPLAAITEILGIPEDERDFFYEHGNRITLVDNPPGSVEAATIDVVGAATKIIVAAEALRAKLNAGDIQSPVLSALNNAILEDGKTPTTDKFISPFQFDTFFILLFLAGNETTRNSLAHGVQALARHPDQWEALKSNPELIDSATEEIVRFATPVRYVRRTALEDGSLGGKNIKAGEKVVVSLTGANRDPKVFDRPHHFDITRDPKDALAFGLGTHSCLGKHLAKLETQVVLNALRKQVDTIELVGKSERVPSSLINNIGSLFVRLTAAR